MTLSILEKAARILEVLTEEIEFDNIKNMQVTGNSSYKRLIYKNQELAEFANLVYRLLHAGMCERNLNGCKHPDWTKEVEEKYRSLFGNEDVPKN